MDKFNKMLAGSEPMVLSIFRIMTGLLLFQYGVAKLFKYPPVPMFEKVELMSLYGAAGTLELVLGGLLILGLFTRPVAFILSGEMAFAYFLGTFPEGLHPAAERRQRGDPVLLRLPLSRLCGRRHIERRCDDAEEVTELSSVIPGWCVSTRPQMCDCTSRNLEIPGSRSARPGMAG